MILLAPLVWHRVKRLKKHLIPVTQYHGTGGWMVSTKGGDCMCSWIEQWGFCPYE